MTEPVETPPRPGGPWREATRPRQREDRMWSVLAGVVLLLVGGYFFLRDTLGFAMPDINWDQMWPLALVVLGGVVILRSLGRAR